MNSLSAETATTLIHAAARRLGESADELSRLDSVAGDGDHGANVAAGFAVAHARIVELQPQTPADVLRIAGGSLSETCGGSAGALLGAFFATLGSRLDGDREPDAEDLVDALELASRRVAEIGRARPGDKTMLDALYPATEGARATLQTTDEISRILAAAAAASTQGAASTAAMRASAGRARFSSNGALGSRDPGAVTMSIIFSAWAETVAAMTSHDQSRESAASSPADGSNAVGGRGHRSGQKA